MENGDSVFENQVSLSLQMYIYTITIVYINYSQTCI